MLIYRDFNKVANGNRKLHFIGEQYLTKIIKKKVSNEFASLS